MSGNVDFQYDKARNILFTDDRWEVRTKEDVDSFMAICEKHFHEIGQPFYMISHIDDLLVHGAVADYYASRIKPLADTYLLGFARWGSNSWARMTLRTTAQKAKMLANIYETRDEAVAAIERQRATAARA